MPAGLIGCGWSFGPDEGPRVTLLPFGNGDGMFSDCCSGHALTGGCLGHVDSGESYVTA